jgi:hypothetical protein
LIDLLIHNMGCHQSKHDKVPGTVKAGHSVDIGGVLTSPNGTVRLKVEKDGLILTNHGRTIWETRTGGKNVTRATLRHDGNLVLSSRDQILWQSGTAGTHADRLAVEDSGRIAIYAQDAICWTVGAQESATLKVDKADKSALASPLIVQNEGPRVKSQLATPRGAGAVSPIYDTENRPSAEDEAFREEVQQEAARLNAQRTAAPKLELGSARKNSVLSG